MKSSPHNTVLIEKYLLKELNPLDKLLFESKLLIDSSLREEVHFQKKTHLLIKMYHREKLKEEMEVLHQQLFTNPSKMDFRKSIQQLFTS